MIAAVASAAVSSAPALAQMPLLRQQPGSGADAAAAAPRPSIADCTWKYYTQPLSHFHEGGTVNGSGTYQQRVCVVDKHWTSPSPQLLPAGRAWDAAEPSALAGPILFYTGNESPVEEYVNNTGLMWSLAPKLGALLVFAEHRYEGESFPEVEGMPNCMSYCSSAEALADFASLITTIKRERDAPTAPVIAFGGSYGGMLSSWFRIKYPNIIDGAIAASAPVSTQTRSPAPAASLAPCPLPP